MKKRVKEHFKKSDPVLYEAYLKVKDSVNRDGKKETFSPSVSDNYFLSLCRTIVGQQLSGLAARAIWTRFLEHFDHAVTPERILRTDEETLRAIGMSWAKVRALKDLAQKVHSKELVLKNLETHPDNEIRERLLTVRGIGPWSVEMFLMFSIGREDMFSYGDLGLLKGMQKVYDLKTLPDKKKDAVLLNRITQKWSPYRTSAATILWRVVDTTLL